MDPEVLSHTTLTTSPCNESIHVPIGHVCMTSDTLEYLDKHKHQLSRPITAPSIDSNKRPVRSYENLPTDGSPDAEIVMDLMSLLHVNTEYEVASHPDVKELIGSKASDIELQRFKPLGPRTDICGTSGDDMYKVMIQWSKIFKFFQPLWPEVYSTDVKLNLITPKKIDDIFKKDINIRVVAGITTISTMKSGGWHAVALLVDRRSKPWSIEYFDSSGSPPNLRFIKLMEDTAKMFTEPTITVAATNRLIHQRTSTECGMHSLIYIRRRLEGVPYTVFSKVKIPDSFAKNFRQYVFAS